MAAVETEHLIAVVAEAADRQLQQLFGTFVSQLAAGTDRTEAAQHFANGLALIRDALRAALYIVDVMDKTGAAGNVEDSARYNDNPRP